MKKFFLFIHFVSFALLTFSQKSTVQEINNIITHNVALEPLLFLASDELMGRSSLRPEINVAARYISEQFKSLGVKQVDKTDEYFQTFTLQTFAPANVGSLTISSTSYNIGKELLQLQGNDVNINAPIIFTGYTSIEELKKIDVKGKIVVINFGTSDSSNFRQGLQTVSQKRELASSQGAAALVTRYRPSEVTWDQFLHHFGQERVSQHEERPSFPEFIVNDSEASVERLIQNGTTASLTTSGNRARTIPARNVLGFIRGTDSKLRDQYIVLSAHYDHVGVSGKPKMEEGKMDSIYNGARDNAIGVAAILNAARYFSKHPPKRSVLFIAYTAEELGLIGSRHYAENPPIPLKSLVYNLNIDNASYNDTTLITVVGLGRTSADNDIKRSCAAFGLTAKPDPAPEQNLFDRSDNVSLAVKGIPAPTFSLGITKFDSTITNRYHQVSDETGNFNLSYAVKYMKTFILTAKNIADNPAQPTWIKNDKYEQAWKELYQFQ